MSIHTVHDNKVRDNRVSDSKALAGTVIPMLSENLKLWARSKAWSSYLNADPNIPPDLRTTLRQLITVSSRWEKAQSNPGLPHGWKLKPRRGQSSKSKKRRNTVGTPCKGCGGILPHAKSEIRRHLWIMQQVRISKKLWARDYADPQARRNRTAPARAARLRNLYDKKLSLVDPRIISKLGRDAVIARIKDSSYKTKHV